MPGAGVHLRVCRRMVRKVPTLPFKSGSSAAANLLPLLTGRTLEPRMLAASKVRIRSTEEERANKELELTKSVPSFALDRRTTAFAAQFRR